ncbi:hypothetical protein N8J89_38935 [Crossiella sp. CA-258035]|uniref:hypothetical protein n=1 Tax=Crossiella sp. CA-258035 TaxID=2981138 RepID=UPI0024BCD4A1|nr:hypothetical protein [Crossiella sp. CA-258035]WHT19008.1 hypothetical protein N8J89_38935 [Crossiella sp. CA-258035]
MTTLPGIPGLPERGPRAPLARVRAPRLSTSTALGSLAGAVATFLGGKLLVPVDPDVPLLPVLVLISLVGGGLGALGGATLGLLRGVGPAAEALPEPAPEPVAPPRPSMARPAEFRAPPPDVWTAMYEECAGSLRRVGHAAEAVPASPARDWLVRILRTMRTELDAARALAETGRRLHAGPEHPARVRLAAAVAEFAAAERHLGEIIVRLAGAPGLHRAGDELRMLEQQLSLLRQINHD